MSGGADGRPVLVTGATGDVGGATVEALLARGVPVRAAGRDPARILARWPGVEAVRLDLRDARGSGVAVAGTSAVLLVRPPDVARVGRTLGGLVRAAREAGTRHAVLLSVSGADRNPVLPHHRAERLLAASGLGWTVLRPGFFAQNLADAYLRDVRDDDRLLLPAPV